MILSKNNPKFKKLKKLLSKKYRNLYQEFLIFGKNIIQEAEKKEIISELYTINPNKEKGILIQKTLMKNLNKNKVLYSQVAVCRMTQKTIETNKILALDDVQDPKNAGVLMRSACAFGFRHIFFSSKSVDYYNEKTIRSSQGAIFNLFLERGNIKKFIISQKEKKYHIFSACVYEKNIDLNKINKIFLKNKKIILVLGNEGIGISNEIKNISDYFLHIKTNPIESLNVSVAGSILMYLLRY
ncbi:TrmH family RNA methyltransferase [Candidatus Phytoplasma melaleucae]|uniref:RNA methyltransferase n=1 Tax=Candidatus Phytoplasma melaleucae TaxID=2982630 RepID=A0ABT9DDQ0_9MOLU|nr:RNA methyltransferase ['Melaleuca sp.' phytoplasma]MDO8168163.1 RNA methyltransferase ['Melaleuca sp.' phytoplasma]